MLFASFCLGIKPAVAEPNPTMNYQGKLTDSSGLAVANGTYNMRFYLYNATGGATTSAIWTEVLTGSNKVQVTNGLFSVMLGSTTPLTSVNFNQTLYLGVEIGGSGSPAWDGEMSPRKILGTVPAAFEAYKLGGVASSSFLRSDATDTASGLLTFTGGFISSASSSITNLLFGTATGTRIAINGEAFTDLTGTGLQNTSGVLSVATSSLGLGDGTFTGLSDTQNSLTANRLIFTNSGGTALTDSASLVFNGTALGIGTTDTSRLLNIAGAANAGARFTDTTNTVQLDTRAEDSQGFMGTFSNHDLRLITNNTSRLTVTTAGRVGIGTTSPLSTLSIQGAGTTNPFLVASSTGSPLLNVDKRGVLTLGSDVTASLFINGGGSTVSPATASTYNTVVGNEAFNYITSSATHNVAMGYHTLYGNSGTPMTGDNNVAIGNNSGSSNTTGSLNAFIGHSAGNFNDTGSSNAFIGAYAGTFNNAGSGNSYFGSLSGYYNQTGGGNVAMGYKAGEGSNSFSYASSTLIGYQTGLSLTTGSQNILLGYSAGDALTSGSNNIVIGHDIDAPSNTGSNQLNIGNTLFGINVDATGTTVDTDARLGIGTSSPYARLSIQGGAGQNTLLAIASSTGANLLNVDKRGVLTLGSGGTASLFINGGGSTVSPANVSRSTVVGNEALTYYTTGAIDNVAMGYRALYGSSTLNMTGDFNVALGNYAGSANTTGASNVFLGHNAGSANTTGSHNSLVGYLAGSSNTTGAYNTFNGSFAGSFNTTGIHNSFIGYSAGTSNTTGSYNSYLGYYAGRYNSTGEGNVALGYYAGEGSSGNSYSNNTMIGYLTGFSLTTGSQNILLGYQAGDALTSGSNNIVIGYDIDAPSATGNNQLNIGNIIFGTGVDSTGTTVDANANIGIGTSSPYAKLAIDGSLALTGGIYDNTATRGTNGQILQTTGTGIEWVATSSLGITGGASTFTALTDTQNSLTANRLIFTNSGGTSLTDSASLVFDGARFGIGTSSPLSTLSIQGAGTTNPFLVASSTGSPLLNVDKRGVLTLGSGGTASLFINGGGSTISPANVTRSTVVGNEALTYYTTGATDNVAMGYRALYGQSGTPMTGTYNVAIGNYAGKDNTTGLGNSFVGASSGFKNTTGLGNSFFGLDSGYSNTTGQFNTFSGAEAGYNNTASNNSFFGGNAGYWNTSGYRNSFFGLDAGYYNQTGGGNVAMGYKAGEGSNINSYASSTLIGYQTGLSLTTGSKNILLGYQAGDALTSGSNNIVIGYDIDAPSNTGSNQLNIGNTLFGINVDATGTTVDTDARLGIGTSSPYARLSIQGGAGQNVALAVASSTGANLLNVDKRGVLTLGSGGTASLFINGGGSTVSPATTGTYNTAIGNQAFNYITTTATDNVAIGYQALFGDLAVNMTGDYNVAIGNQAGFNNETGGSNIFIGDHSGYANNNGSANIFIGSAAGYSNSIGSNNAFFGTVSGYSNTTGSNNAYFGYYSGMYNQTGTANVALGYNAGEGTSNNSYASSTLIGYQTGLELTTGSKNILLGYQAGDALTSGSNNIVIGYDIDAPSNTGSNQLNIGNTLFGINVDATGTTVDTDARLGIGTSSPYARLSIQGGAGQNFALAIASSTGANLLNVDKRGVLTLGSGGTASLFINGGGSTVSPATTSTRNTIIGNEAFSYITTTATDNIALGYRALLGSSTVLMTGDNNIALGNAAGLYHTTGESSVFVGNSAGERNTTGSYNTYLGRYAGRFNQVGAANVALGYQSGWGSSTYSYSSSTLIGYYTGRSLTTGSKNTLLGYQAGDEITSGSNNIVIGYDIDAPSNTASNQLNIGNSIFGINVDSTGTTVDTDARLGIGTSSPYARLAIAQSTPTVSGSELVTNGTFTGNASGWTLQSGCSVYGSNQVTVTDDAGCQAGADWPALQTTFSSVSGTTYRINFTLSGVSSTSVNVLFLNNLNPYEGDKFTNGNHTIYLKTDFTGTETITFESPDRGVDATWVIDNVSIQAVTSTITPTLAVTGIDGSVWLSLGGDILGNTMLGKNTGLLNTGYNNSFVGSLAGMSNTTGSNNAFFGSSAGRFNTTGDANSFFGNSAGSSNTTGGANSFFGESAGSSNTTGSANSFVGSLAGMSNTTGTNNAFFGNYSGSSNDTGDDNSFFGRGSGLSNVTGSRNSFFGYQAGVFSISSNDNSFFGHQAGASNNGGNANSFFGLNAGYSNYTGSNNAFFGTYAGSGNDTGSNNAFFGNSAGGGNLSGSANVAFGYQAGLGTYGDSYASSTLIGYQTGLALTTGSKNILLGYQAGDALTSGSNNIVIGYDIDAPSNTGSNQLNIGNTLFGINVDSTGTTVDTDARLGIGTSSPYARLSIQGGAGQNFALAIASSTGANLLNVDKRGVLTLGSGGTASLFINGGGSTVSPATASTYNTVVGNEAFNYITTTATNNVAMGYQALYGSSTVLMTGDNNVAIGNYAGYSNTTGLANVFLGSDAGYSNTTGSANSFLGNFVGYSNTTGSSNAFYGEETGFYNTTGSYNSFFGGELTGYDNTTGSYNSFFGTYAGQFNQTGSANVALGYNAGEGTSGNSYASSTLIGYQTGLALTTGSKNLLLGYQAGDALTSGSNNIVIGYDIDAPSNTGSNQLNIGNTLFGINVNSTGTTVDTDARLGIGTSSPYARLAIAQSAPTVSGSELVTNGTFTGNASGWTLSDCITYGSNQVSSNYLTGCEAPWMTTNFSSVAGTTYRLTFTLSGVAGSLPFISLSNSTLPIEANGASFDASFGNGTHTIYFKTDYTGTETFNFRNYSYLGSTWTIDNVSIQAVTSTITPTLAVTGYDGSVWLSLGGDILGNTALGKGTLAVNTIGNSNTANGYYAGASNTVGYQNSFFGSYAGRYNVDGNYNTFIGASAGESNVDGSSNTFVGALSGMNNTSGAGNAFFGTSAGGQNITGGANAFFGSGAGANSTSSTNNSFFGSYAGGNATAGDYNSFFGSYAGGEVIAGFSNTYIGSSAGTFNQYGNYNTFVGENAGSQISSGYANTALGYFAGAGVFGEAYASSTIIGYRAGATLSNGSSKNLLLGYQVGDEITSGSNNILIGYDIDAATTTANNTLNIGNSIFGINVNATGTTTDTDARIGIGTSSPYARLAVAQSTPTVTGAELVTNGTFTGNASGWTLQSGCSDYGTNNVVVTYDVGCQAGADVPSVSTTFASVASTTYRLSFTLSGVSGDTVYFYLTSNSDSRELSYYDDGTYTVYFEAGYTGTDDINFQSGTIVLNNTWTIDNVSIQAVTSTITPTLAVTGYDGSTWLSLGGDISGNTALGKGALVSNTSFHNTAQGLYAGNSNTTGSFNTFTGALSGMANTTGYNNTFVGASTGVKNTTGVENTFVGTLAGLFNTTGSSNSFFGNSAGGSNDTGSYNSFFGSYAGSINTTGSTNSFFGYNSGFSNTTGSSNSFFGDNSGGSNTTGSYNSFLGSGAGFSNTTGSYNTTVGISALINNETGSANVALGYNAGEGTFANSYASSTMIGYQTGLSLTTGSQNLLLGYQAGDALTSGSNNIVIGYDIDAPSNTASNQLNIGNVIFGLNVNSTGTTVDPDAQIGIGTSSPYGNSRLTIAGTTTIGNGTTNLRAGLQIGYGGLCVDNDGACVASTTGRITGVQIQSGNSDLAEVYFSADEIPAGTIVTLAGGLSIKAANKADETPVLGIVSTKPGFTLGFDDKSLNAGEDPYPVALSGRVPVILSTENGPIKKGDQLMLSTLTGMAMKATGTGAVIGIALEDFDEDRKYSDTYVNQFSDDIADERYGEDSTESNKKKVVNELKKAKSDTVYLYDGTPVKVGQIVVFVNLGYRWVDDSMATMLAALMNGGATSTEENASSTLAFGDGEGLLATVVEAVTRLWNKVTGIEEKVNKLEAENEELRKRMEQIEAQTGVENNNPEVIEEEMIEEEVPPTEEEILEEPAVEEVVEPTPEPALEEVIEAEPEEIVEPPAEEEVLPPAEEGI